MGTTASSESRIQRCGLNNMDLFASADGRGIFNGSNEDNISNQPRLQDILKSQQNRSRLHGSTQLHFEESANDLNLLVDPESEQDSSYPKEDEGDTDSDSVQNMDQNTPIEESTIPSMTTNTAVNVLAKFSRSHSTYGNTYWCLVKVKTRHHDSSRVSRRSTSFEVNPHCSFVVGSSETCDMRLEDDRCAPENAVLEPLLCEGCTLQGIRLTPSARMYKLVGMGSKRSSQPTILYVGAVIKIGSISLEVTDLCTDESEKFSNCFAQNTTSCSPGVENKISMSTPLSLEDSSGNNDEDMMCYICWNGKDKSDHDVEEIETNERYGEALKANPDFLIRNPCGNCSGCSGHVHINCLLRWIKSSGSDHCSICNGELPPSFCSPSPKLELKVVRHRRGRSWSGSRRFRISFANNDVATIGRMRLANVRLCDRSVGNLHARIVFNREVRQFELIDCESQGGTFLQLKSSIVVSPLLEGPVFLKIGRSLLSVKVTQRKGMLLNMLAHISRNKR